MSEEVEYNHADKACNHNIETIINCYNDFLLVTKFCKTCNVKLGTTIIHRESILEPEEIISTEDSIL